MRERVHHGKSSTIEEPRARSDEQDSDGERRALLRLAQAKLTVGAAGDKFEREADQVADRVMAVIQRLSAGAPSAHVVDVNSHRCGPACVHRHGGHGPEVGPDGGHLDDSLSTRVMQAAGTGAALAEPVRRSMETAFGTDFSSVRVHADSDVAPRIGASAFTLGHDIHFAAGQYRPADRSGMWLLSHELTHVVQQTGTAQRSDRLRRHSSKEHFMLGNLKPSEIASIADARQAAETAKGTGMKAKFKNLFTATTPPPKAAVDDALTTIREQIAAIENWRTVSGPDDAGPLADVKKGGTLYSHKWGGQLLTIPCRDGEVVCTVGDMNALPDFFGSYDDLRLVDKSIAFKTFQVIRRESYIYLKQLEAQLLGKSYEYERKRKAFSGIEKNTISLPNAALPAFGDAVVDVIDSASMLSGKNGEVGLDASITADATLGRNACHFPPESWLRWRDHHERARALIASATSIPDLEAKANHAIGLNAFGEHYLQDSFAAGHLINKGFVMAVAMEHVSAATKKVRGMDDPKIQALQQATAHSGAYAVPKAAHKRERGKGPAVGPLEDQASMTARDPQSALEAAKRKGAATLGSDNAKSWAAKREEMSASGINPNSMSFEQYRTWLNDLWLQKITNTLHDKYCLKGLEVSSPDKKGLFRIYGDSNMMRSSEGAEYTAETSLMSRTAINRLVNNKRNALTPATPGKPVIPPKPVTNTNAILARFPNTVKDDDGTVMSLEQWATGAEMRKKIKELVDFFTTERWKEGKLTGVVKGLSVGKTVAAGLGAKHGPF